MSVRFILEQAPDTQAQGEFTFHGGQQNVGRGETADWRIDDPDQYVSRKHFIIAADGDVVTVTDASSGGLFVDAASEPLGAGKSTVLKHGMRLRFGDFVARVEMVPTEVTETVPPPPEEMETETANPFVFDFSRSGKETAAQGPQRPANLPDPFGLRPSGHEAGTKDPGKRCEPVPLDQEDPFALALKPVQPQDGELSAPLPGASSKQDVDILQNEGVKDLDDFALKHPASETDVASEPAASEWALSVRVSDTESEMGELRAAFYKGLGLDPDRYPTDDPMDEMEVLGRRFRSLTDGLVMLLQIRAREKQNVRVAHTVIGAANVNPLKYAVNADDGVGALVADRGAGYLDPDAALQEAFRDLTDHNMRTWTGIQTALRQMIDKFEPAEIEREMEETGMLEALLAGGRHAKLWQLYRDRYTAIARSAEDRFLGEVGANFREAYENDANGNSGET